LQRCENLMKLLVDKTSDPKVLDYILVTPKEVSYMTGIPLKRIKYWCRTSTAPCSDKIFFSKTMSHRWECPLSEVRRYLRRATEPVFS